MTKNCCVVIYPDSHAVEQALGELQSVGCDLRQVSVIGSGCHGEAYPVGIYCTDERMRFLGHQDIFWNTIWGQLAGAAFFWEPDFGPLAVAGRVIDLMVNGLEGAEFSDGFSFPGTALFVTGVPRGSINEYEQAIKAEKFLLLVDGERRDVERACGALHGETQQVTVHHA
ncbi:MAG TPA: DUF1269 domain-containing protein [Gammaproteobacteria bacterium]|nr:DUF1269 domain-containing protein [Gammaproteobacteria bacterium]